MKQLIQGFGILSILVFFGSWQLNKSSAAQAMDVPEWEDSTAGANTLPDESSKAHFHRFLTEGKDNALSLATLEWLDLPFAETPYKSWYLGLANGYHLFNLQADADPQLNLIVFDNSGHIRDRHQFAWGSDGGAMNFINGQVLQLQLYNESSSTTGIDLVNLLIDLNGQFEKLAPVAFVHPARQYPEVSLQPMLRTDLESKSRAILKAMADEILAANGEVFSDPTQQSYYEHTDWYKPNPVDKAIELHPIEAYNMANIQLILSSLSI